MRSFVFSNRREAIVIEGGGTGGLRHSAVDRRGRQDIAHTAAQFATQVERSESAARFSQMRSGRLQRELAALQRKRNRIMREAQQQGTLFWREFLGGDL